MVALKRERLVVDDGVLAQQVGDRIREARIKQGLTQQQLAQGRYTKAYVSALEKGRAKPSMAALTFLAERLGLSPAQLVGGDDARWSRLEADLLVASGRWQEAVDAYTSLAATAKSPAARAETLAGCAEALCRIGRGMDAIRPATEALELFRKLGRERDAVMAGYWLANALYLAENSAEARSVLRMLLDQVRAGAKVDPDIQIRLLTAASYVETWDGNHQAAVTYLEEARGLSADLDDRRRAAFLSALAVAYYDRGDLEGAIRAGSQSLALFHAADAKHEVALLENNLANAYLAVGNLTRAAELVAHAHRQHEESKDDRDLASVLDTEARIRLAAGDVDAAKELATRAVEAARAVDNRKAVSDSQLTLARTAVQAGDLQGAMEMFEQVADVLREQGPRGRLSEVLTEWAEIVASLGDHQKAYELTRDALRGSTQVPAR